jgi:hypothetical protein
MKSLEQPIPPSLTDLLNATKRNLSTAINCVEVGIIKEFDIETQTATVQFALKRVTNIFPDGTRTVEERPILLKVPILVLFGGNAFLSMPISPNDNCILLFNDREIDQWFANGGIQTPISYRVHSVSDAFAIVGIRNLQNSISDYLENGIRLSYNPTSRISITEDIIETIANLFKHNGNMEITGDLSIEGDTETKGDINFIGGVKVNSISGATGTFANSVTVINGIVTAGS